MKELLEIITKIYEDEELRNTCIPLFLSNPGMGKTSTVKEFAKSKGVNCLTEIASTKMPHEFSGIAIPDHDTKRMTYFDYDAILNLKDGDILFLDEMLNANPMILNAFLTVLEDRVLPSGKKLANIMIIAAGNPQGSVSLTPQIKERFVWYQINFDKDSWKQYMSKYFITDEIYEQLCVLIKNETFSSSEKNYYTPRSIEKAVKMLLADVKTPYSKKLTPILNTMIQNTSGQDLLVGTETWRKDELLPWLKIQKLKNEITTIS